MANTIGFGQGAVNNTNGFGKAPTNNTIDFGEVCDDSWSPETNLTGTASTPSFSNTKSINLDGIDDRVEINRTLGSGFSELSISAWVKYASNLATSNRYEPIVAKIGPSFGNSFVLQNMRSGASSNGGELYFNVQTPNGSFNAFSGVVPSQNVWYNVVGTYDGSNVKIYIDGILKATLSATGSINSNTELLMLGDAGYGGFSSILNGNLDEISIYSRGLTQSEVTNIYNSGTPNDVSTISNIEAYWRMGDGDTANTITDNVGSNNGTMVNMNASNFVTDVPSFTNTKSILLDGVDDYVQVPNSTSLNITTALSVSAWFKTTSANGMYLLTQGSGSQVKYYIQFYAPINRIQVRIWDGSAVPITIDNTQVFDDGQWHNIVLTTDALTTTDGVKIYFDGTLLTNKGTLSNSGLYTTAAGLFIGQIPNTARFNGNIDEVSLFNSELSQSDVTSIYGGGTPSSLSSYSSLVSWWRFEGTGTTATDSGSGGNDGTLINGVTRSTDVPFNYKSIQLDGVDDYVDIGNPSNLSTITSISISAWFKTTDTVGGLVIVGSDDQIQGRRYILRTHNSSGIKLRFFSFSSNSSFDDIIGTTNINDGQWHHVMAINNGTNLKIYIDGVLDNSNTNGNLINTTFATPNINIGRRSYSGNENYFSGNIDEVAIWSSDQSANVSAIGGTIPTDLSAYNPLGWWRCGDGDTAPTLTDNGSGGNDGTMTNFTTFSTDVPT
jgi:hypothetical protein